MTPRSKPTSTNRRLAASNRPGWSLAPLVWAMLGGILIGVLSITPAIPYPFGGGFIPLSVILINTLAGLTLGPWMGALAGLIGGCIGLWLAPQAYPLGLVDILRTGMLPPLIWGLAHPRYRRLYLSLAIASLLICALWPYHIPGEAVGYHVASEPGYWLSAAWAFVGLLVYSLWQKKFLQGLGQPSLGQRWLFAVLYNISPATTWLLPWSTIYFAWLNYPPALAALFNLNAWWLYILPFSLVTGSAVVPVIDAFQRFNRPALPDTILYKKNT